MVRLTRWFGLWIVRGFAWIVALGYFLFRPGRVGNSLRFYRALLPERSRLGRWWLTFRQYQSFARLFTERIRLARDPEYFRCTMEGLEHLEDAVAGGQGGLLLMSHAGNWEIAARLLGRLDHPLLLYMEARGEAAVEEEQKDDVRHEGVRIIALPAGQTDALAGLEGLRFLRDGGLVSIAADRGRDGPEPKLEVDVLGHPVALPRAPWVLGLVSGAPLIQFFAWRRGRRDYHFVALPPQRIEVDSRRERDAALTAAAQGYVDQLLGQLRAHPEQWYHFEDWLAAPSAPAPAAPVADEAGPEGLPG